jgi:hypothetical protein
LGELGVTLLVMMMTMMMMMMGWKTSVKNSLHLSGSIHSSSFAAWLRRLFMFSLRKCLRLHLEGGCSDASVHVFLGLHWAAVVLGVHLATWTRTAEWKLACWVVFCEFSLAYQLPTRVLSIFTYR